MSVLWASDTPPPLDGPSLSRLALVLPLESENSSPSSLHRSTHNPESKSIHDFVCAQFLYAWVVSIKCTSMRHI